MTNSEVRTMRSEKSDEIAHKASWRHFARHFVEMVVAMVVGMMGLGALESLFLAWLGYSVDDISATVVVLVMAANMVIGMSLWMRHRRHGWASIREMGAAMFLAFAVLLVPFWANLLSEDVVFGLGHVLMLPFMLVVMLRHMDVYGRDHRSIPLPNPREKVRTS